MKINILLVDDQHPELFRQLLAIQNGFEITTCKRGDHAIQLARTNAFDLILMDLRLPGIDGLSAIRLIRSFDKSVAIVAFSAYGDKNTRQKVIEAGADDYFNKPANYNRLHQRLLELAVKRPVQVKDQKEKLAKQRRLNFLREQAARKGIDTEAHILAEIEDLKKELGE